MNDKLKILIVDDEDSLRISLASILELEGYEVKTAENGLKAIELAKKENFDIMFSDIRMPGITGTETFKQIKKIKPDIVGVMMTAYALNDLIIDALNSGAFACLSKPFEIDTVLSTIKDITTRPFAVIIDKETNLNKNISNSLTNCGLNVASSEIDSNKIDFLFTHKPDILIINIESDNNQILTILKRLKELFGTIPQTILVGNKRNDILIERVKELGDVSFFNLPIKPSQVFQLLNPNTRKKNIAMINTDSEDFETLNDSLVKEGFHLLYYPDCKKLFEQLNNSFFDLVLINVNIETNIVEFHEQLHQQMPNIGAIYILNDDKNLESIKGKGCFYLTKPFEIDNVVNLINKILGK